MATITPTITPSKTMDRTWRVRWETLTTTNDVGGPFANPSASDRSVQVEGTFGAGGNCRIEGRNDPAGNWRVLSDPQGNDLDITAAGIYQVSEITSEIRPHITAGDGTTDIDVDLLAKKID